MSFRNASIFFLALFSAAPAFAGFKGTIQFSDEERRAHAAGVGEIIREASQCLEEDLDRHRKFFDRYGVSAFYGDRSSFSELSTAGKQALLRKLGKPVELLAEMRPTSCIGLAMKCLERGFTRADQLPLWKRLKAYAQANDLDGTALQNGLQKLGWKLLYWNADTSRNEAWDAAERSLNATNSDHFWGEHAYYWKTVNASRKYYLNTVDDITTLVNFGEKAPASFRELPFFIGTAHSGYHVFPGEYGRVIEGHSTRSITDPNTMESSEFSPISDGGGPRGLYRSGLIAVPPR
jgi:hypothetical protein